MKKAIKRYNLSNIMKKAWELKMYGAWLGVKFSDCLKRAWREAKIAVAAKELPEKVNVMCCSNNLTINFENGEISGETYEIRKHIKYGFAAKWNATKKVWVSTLENENLREVVIRDCIVC